MMDSFFKLESCWVDFFLLLTHCGWVFLKRLRKDLMDRSLHWTLETPTKHSQSPIPINQSINHSLY